MEKISGVKQELPVDLLFQILTKLPAKSLCRLRCVSKLWRSIIDDPSFVEAHRACSAARQDFLILFRGLQPSHHPYTCVDAVGRELHSSDNRGLTRTYGILVSVQESTLQGGYMSQQAGSLYCRCFPDFVRVWNPTICESLDIKAVGPDGESVYNIFHFGFDPIEKKHKVLNLLLESYTGKVIGSHVFILEEDNCWRNTANPYPPCLRVLVTERVICTDGIIFSYTPTADSSGKKLSAFHVRLETFEVFPLPKTAPWRMLIEFMGCATLVGFDFVGPFKGRITLWMLEDPRKHVWRSKTCMVPPNYDLVSLFLHGGTPAGELLFTGGRENLLESFFLLLYNVESGAARRINVQGLPEHIPQQIRLRTPERVYFHVESLKTLNIFLRKQEDGTF